MKHRTFFFAFALLLPVLQAHAQSPPPAAPSENMELYFYRTPGQNFIDDMKINLSLVGVVFNEAGFYRTEVESAHPQANDYDCGRSIVGIGPYYSQALDLPQSGWPAAVGWESAKTNDTPQSPTTAEAYCPGMLGWGLYKVRLSYAQPSDTLDAFEFYISTVDGNWGVEGQEMDFNFYLYAYPGAPRPRVWNYATQSWQWVTYGEVLNSWDIHIPARNRDHIRAGYDYALGDTATVPFVIIDDTDYPRENDEFAITIRDATLDVNTRLEADIMNVPWQYTFRIADWYGPSSGYESTTVLADADAWLHVGGELYLQGHGNTHYELTVFLSGMSQQRGYWQGVELSDGAYMSSDHAAIEYTVIGINLTGGTSADVSNTLIRAFAEYGIHQDSHTRVIARNSVIREGSIGVYATGRCIGSVYGWNEENNPEPVWVMNNDGHGFELENLVNAGDPATPDQALTFCIQHSIVTENRLYGIWHHGEGAPLIQENEISFNGLYGGGAPSHDGLHVNGSTALSVHKNFIYGNAYGIHHVDPGHIYGKVNPTVYLPNILPVDRPKVGFNCVHENTFNLGGGRGAETHLGRYPNGDYEADGTPKKWNGSNSFLNPIGMTQVTLNNNLVELEHNYWYPYYNFSGSGQIEINGDFAAPWHDLPCTEEGAPYGGDGGSEITLSSLSTEMQDLRNAVDQRAWAQARALAFTMLGAGPTRLEALAATNALLSAYAATRDTTLILSTVTLNASLSATSTRDREAFAGTLHALRGMYMIARNAVQALAVCDALITHFPGTEDAFSGKLYKSFIYSGILGDDVNALAVVNDMLRDTPDDPEVIAQYYSITHSYPKPVPKRAAAAENAGITLAQNYPNPFNPRTTITVRLAWEDVVRLQVFDTKGRLLRTLHEGTLPAGAHEFTFDAHNLPSGLYRCVLTTGSTRLVRTMTYVK